MNKEFIGYLIKPNFKYIEEAVLKIIRGDKLERINCINFKPECDSVFY